MNLQSILIIFTKELKDILRDRRTIFSMLLLPILIFPLFFIGPQLFIRKQMEKIEEKLSQIVLIDPEETGDIRHMITGIPGIEILDLKVDSAAAVELIRAKEAEALVIVDTGFQENLQAVTAGDILIDAPKISVYTNKTRTQGRMTSEKIVDALREYRTRIAEGVLSGHGLPESLVEPFMIFSGNIASAKEMSRFIMGMILPYILILMAMIGAMYPAIDLTAGEKERGTLETLLVSGVLRAEIVLGKFLTVFSASLITATLSVASMAVTGILALKSDTELSGLIQLDIGFREVILMIIALVPLSAIFSSLLMAVSLFAKSYREAQSYVSPLMFLVIIPAMSSMMPDSEPSRELAVIPILNVSMTLKDGLAGTIDPVITLITMAVNILLAAVGLYIVMRMFKRESVLFRI